MRHHNDDQHDALNDYLDSLAGAPSPASRTGDLEATMHDGVDHFFDLAEKAGMRPRAQRQPGRPPMNATLPASGALPTSQRQTQRSVTLPAWTQHLHMLWTGLLIAAVIALSFAAFGPNGLGGRNGGTGDGPGHFSAVPVATVPDDAVTSSIPYPTAEECTVEPMTREELIAHLEAANAATNPDEPRYNIGIEASKDDAEAIMNTFRSFQACSKKGQTYAMQFETPWRTANSAPIFGMTNGGDMRPVQDAIIEAYTDELLAVGSLSIPNPQMHGTSDSPPEVPVVPGRLPVPDGATPVTSPYGGNPNPTIFPEDITMTRPNTAMATAYFVIPETRQVMIIAPLTYEFIKVDGQWLINQFWDEPYG